MTRGGTSAAGMRMCIADDILNFGVPMEVDTGANKSGHKPAKKAAMLAQRIEEKFNYQTAQRLQEMHVLELALAEIEGKCMWFSGCCSDEFPAITNNSDKQSTGGAKFKVYYDTDSQENRAKLMSSIAGDDPINLEADLINFVADLQGKVRDCLPERQPLLQTSHKRNGTIFRGHPCFRGNVWRDWVVIDWGDEGRLPNKICGFLDLMSANIPHNHGTEHAGTDIEAAVCAIAENAACVEVDNASGLGTSKKQIHW